MLVQLSAHRIDVLNPDGELPETLLRQGEYVESRGLVSRILPQRTIDQQFIAQGAARPSRAYAGPGGPQRHSSSHWRGHWALQNELIKPRGPWRTVEQVEIAVLEYVDCFNHRRPNETGGDIPPAELETAYYRQNTALAEAGQTDSNLSLPDSPGRFRPSTNPHHAAYLPPDTAIRVWPLADPLLDWEVLT